MNKNPGDLADYVGLDRDSSKDLILYRVGSMAQLWAKARKLELSIRPLSESSVNSSSSNYPQLDSQVKAARARVLFEYVCKICLDVDASTLIEYKFSLRPKKGLKHTQSEPVVFVFFWQLTGNDITICRTKNQLRKKQLHKATDQLKIFAMPNSERPWFGTFLKPFRFGIGDHAQP